MRELTGSFKFWTSKLETDDIEQIVLLHILDKRVRSRGYRGVGKRSAETIGSEPSL